MKKGEVLVLFPLPLLLDVVLLEAEVLATDGYEVDAELELHFHAEYLVADELLLVVSVLAAELEGESLFLVLESVVLVCAELLVDELDLVPSDVAFVLVAGLVLVLDPDEDNEKPFIDDGVEVEVDVFDNLVLLVLVLGDDLQLVLLLEADLVVLPQELHQHQLHVEVHYGQASQLGVVGLVVGEVAVFPLFALLCYLLHLGHARELALAVVVVLGSCVGVVAQQLLVLVEFTQVGLCLLDCSQVYWPSCELLLSEGSRLLQP